MKLRIITLVLASILTGCCMSGCQNMTPEERAFAMRALNRGLDRVLGPEARPQK